MFKSLFLPVILMTMVGGPMLYSRSQRTPLPPAAGQYPANVNTSTALQGMPIQAAPYASPYSAAVRKSPVIAPNARTLGQPQLPPQLQTTYQPTSMTTPPVPQFDATISTAGTMPVANQMVFNQQAWNQPGMVPDYGRAETIVFPGDASGPDLNATPMSFVPVTDFATLFRFDLTKDWVTSRWDRVSTTPADRGLHGMRVALVTGTNSWDLHGSLTYFFDANHRVQRISFRGWTGDATRLLQTVAVPYQLRPQPTHWAGLYVSQNSGLLMKHPAVIDKSNPVQQLAIVLELNNPQGRTQISEEFKTLLKPALAVQ